MVIEISKVYISRLVCVLKVYKTVNATDKSSVSKSLFLTLGYQSIFCLRTMARVREMLSH